MNIVALDGYAANPGDLSWDELKTLGQCTIYERTAPRTGNLPCTGGRHRTDEQGGQRSARL